MGKTLMIIILPIMLDGVSCLHEKVFHMIQVWQAPPPRGCGLWLFLWVGTVALVLALPPDDRCGVMIIIGHIWFQWSRLKVSPS